MMLALLDLIGEIPSDFKEALSISVPSLLTPHYPSVVLVLSLSSRGYVETPGYKMVTMF